MENLPEKIDRINDRKLQNFYDITTAFENGKVPEMKSVKTFKQKIQVKNFSVSKNDEYSRDIEAFLSEDYEEILDDRIRKIIKLSSLEFSNIIKKLGISIKSESHFYCFLKDHLKIYKKNSYRLGTSDLLGNIALEKKICEYSDSKIAQILFHEMCHSYGLKGLFLEKKYLHFQKYGKESNFLFEGITSIFDSYCINRSESFKSKNTLINSYDFEKVLIDDLCLSISQKTGMQYSGIMKYFLRGNLLGDMSYLAILNNLYGRDFVNELLDLKCVLDSNSQNNFLSFARKFGLFNEKQIGLMYDDFEKVFSSEYKSFIKGLSNNNLKNKTESTNDSVEKILKKN